MRTRYAAGLLLFFFFFFFFVVTAACEGWDIGGGTREGYEDGIAPSVVLRRQTSRLFVCGARVVAADGGSSSSTFTVSDEAAIFFGVHLAATAIVPGIFTVKLAGAGWTAASGVVDLPLAAGHPPCAVSTAARIGERVHFYSGSCPNEGKSVAPEATIHHFAITL